MKKYLKVITLCLMAVLLLSGCTMKAEYGIVVEKNKNVKFEIISAQDDELLDSLMNMASSDESESESDESDSSEKTYTDAERWAYLESQREADDNKDKYKDYTVTKYEKDGYKGYVYTKTLGKIDDLVSEDGAKVELDESNTSKFFKKDGNKYSLNIKLSDEESEQMSQYSSSVMFDIKLRVTLSKEAISNNATTVEGTTYIWDLTKTQYINLTFDFGPDLTFIAICAGVGLLVIVIVLVLVITLSKKKNKTTTNEVPAAPVETPVSPVTPVTPETVPTEPSPVAPSAQVIPAEPAQPVVSEVPVAPVQEPVAALAQKPVAPAPVQPATPVAPEVPVAPATTDVNNNQVNE